MKKEASQKKDQHESYVASGASGYLKDESILGFIEFDRHLVPSQNKLYVQKFSDGLYKVSKGR